ncbi:MAG: hypothetical protein JJU37_02755 [Balneolaceae bacterium]|nr:hypothetical protein [Balneolaceae bacterium]
MRKPTILLFFILLFPVLAIAQQSDEEDPFKRDPIFTKSLDELLGISQTREDVETERETAELNNVVRRLSVSGVDLGGSFEAGPYYSNALYSQYPNLPAFHFNRVNGLFIGVKKERMQWHRRSSFLNIPQIDVHGFIGYGTASRSWDYAIGLEKMIGRSNRLLVGFEYHNATATEDFRRVGLVETSITSFLAGYDYLDYHHMEGFGIYTAYRTNRWVEAAFSYNRNTFTSIEQNTAYTMFGYSRTYRPNPAIDWFSDEIDLDIYSVSLSLNPRNILITNHFTAAGTIVAELADNGASDEEYRFNKYRAEAKMFYNFEPGSVLRLRVQGGKISGDAPDFKNFHLGGIGTLRGSPYKFFSGDRMLLSNLEVQFGRPSRRAGEWIRDYNFHILLFLDSGWTTVDSREPVIVIGPGPIITPQNGASNSFSDFSFADLQHDAGIGIGSGVFRLELAWPLRTFDSSPIFWVRLNPTF